MTKQQEFINKIATGAIEAYKKYGILPSLTIAQGCLESAFGRSSIGNNAFGIKANSAWTGKKQLVWTTEYYNGVKTKVQAWFRDYNNIEESIIDHALLLTKQRYLLVRTSTEYKAACVEIQKAGYATDPKYSDKLQRIIEAYQLYKYDTPVKPVIKKTVSASALNIRNTPSTGSKVIGTYKQNDIVTILEVSGGWSKTDKGWISSKYIK